MRRLNDKGSALVLVVFTMLIVFFLGFALLEVSTIDFAMANNQVDGVKAYYIAEAGMNKAIASFFYDSSFLQQLPVALQVPGNTTTLEISESFGGGNFSNARVELISKTTEYMVIELLVSGTYNNAKRELVSQGKLNFGQMDQFMASDTAVICVEQFSTENGSLYVDGNVFSLGGINCGWNSIIKGDTYGYGNVSVDNGTVDGNLYGTGNVAMGWDANVAGDVTGRGTITVDGGNDIGGDVFGSGHVWLKWDADVGGSVKSLNSLTMDGANNVGGDVFGSGVVNLKGQSDIMGGVISLNNLLLGGANNINGNVQGSAIVNLGWDDDVDGSISSLGNISLAGGNDIGGSVLSSGSSNINGAVNITGDFFSMGDMELSWNDRFQGNVVCFETFTDGGGCNYNQNIFGSTVVMKKSGTNVTGNIYYVDDFEKKNNSPYTATRISSSQMPSFPDPPVLPTAPDPPEIKTFPGIPNVTIEDYQGQPGTKTITSADLTSGRLNMSTLTSGVYYVDDSIANLQIYGNYSGAISLVSKGKITVYSNVLRTDTINDALMLLSFKNSTSDSAIYLEWNTTIDALLFAPVGIISDNGTPTINGGVMGKIVNIGWSGEVYHIESILNKFGLGNTGIQSFEVMNWRQTSGML